MIRVEHLSKRYGERVAVDDITFSVEPGEIIGFLGPNGAGKSTTLRMLTGFLSPNEGRIRIGEVDAVADPVRARRSIGYMPESVPLYRELRVTEYLRHRARLKGVPRKGIPQRVDAALEQANVADVRDRIIGQLSKGYRSRVGLADALVADPPLLVLDEPTAGLDPNQIRQVRDLIKGMAGEKTVLLSTHILPEVESTCGRVVIIHRGRLVGSGEPGALRLQGRGEHVLSLESRAPRSELEPLVAAVPGVHEVIDAVERPDEQGGTRLRLRADAPDVAETVFKAVADAGLTLRELRGEQASLEDVFANLTMRDRALDEGARTARERPAQEEDTAGAQPAESDSAAPTSESDTAKEDAK